MFEKVRRTLRNLRSHTSGNATLLMALGMPALVGGTGIAVDVSQWYMWKRELQYAVDQSALAGAWARTDESLSENYATRAQQEFTANTSMTTTIATTPVVSLANYAGGSNNSVAVSATASQRLPFSSFLTGQTTTVYVFAQASFASGSTFTSCIIAVDDDADGAVTIGGSSVLTAGCGIAALSDSDEAIRVNGNPDIDAGWVLAKGGIDDWFDTHTDDEIHENMSGLYDPFAELSPPNPTSSQTAKTYACVAGGTTTTADKTVVTTVSYTYKRGSNANNAVAYAYSSPRAGSTTSAGPTNLTVTNGTVAGTTNSTTTTSTKISGSGQNSIWEVKTTAVATTYANVVATTTQTQASLTPGTYTDLQISCKTVFSSGVYILNGGQLKIPGQYEVTGAGVMFVLKGGASIHINGGSNVNLTAITSAELMAQGVSSVEANKLSGMLVFEDRSSTANANANKLNGNAATVLNGTIYLPNSHIAFEGTASVTSQCLMIAANMITITGTANMTTFCPAGVTEDTVIATEGGNVKLVA
ncbi:MAG: pilus assembly protein TadG-related protein [Novosphingobium sp.]